MIATPSCTDVLSSGNSRNNKDQAYAEPAGCVRRVRAASKSEEGNARGAADRSVSGRGIV